MAKFLFLLLVVSSLVGCQTSSQMTVTGSYDPAEGKPGPVTVHLTCSLSR